MLEFLAALLSWPLALIGCVFVVSGAVGLVRFPDLYTRLHAAGVTDTGATIFLVLPMVVQALLVYGNLMVAIKLVLILFFTLITAPTASHALAKTALLSGLGPRDGNGKPLLESYEATRQIARSRSDVSHSEYSRKKGAAAGRMP
ncbi:MAG: hypothetical protein CSB44_03935 [Gammaproteobacteria bacterium]|nr:MAG: hypothetical protein CSB44_03935 [Gammaproteobacteria bacterium]PIE37466.1 MAG: hypothetical protein CSA54_01295 [Gammaproteobacteria bacterium]